MDLTVVAPQGKEYPIFRTNTLAQIPASQLLLTGAVSAASLIPSSKFFHRKRVLEFEYVLDFDCCSGYARLWLPDL